jgi:hypothetical protein
MFRVVSVPIIRSTITAVDNHWYNIWYVGHITGVALTQPQWCDQPPDLVQFLKPTLPQGSRSNVTYVVPVVVNCSYCTPVDGYGKYPNHVESSCNKIKILVLHLVGHFVCIYINLQISKQLCSLKNRTANDKNKPRCLKLPTNLGRHISALEKRDSKIMGASQELNTCRDKLAHSKYFMSYEGR